MHKTFYYLWVKRFFDIRKRETQSCYDNFSICLPSTTTCSTRRKASASSENQPSSSNAKTQLTDFSQIPQIFRARFRWMTSFTSPSHITLWDFYFDISEWHILPTYAWTPALILHQSNTCAKRKVLSLTKPKGKIYKTKSLGHYIIC